MDVGLLVHCNSKPGVFSDGTTKTSVNATTIQCRGATLLEAMVTMAISAILVAIALPGFERFGINSVLTNTTNVLSASLSRARAEAIKARRNVRMCPTSDNSTCDVNASWADGWIMFVDRDGNGMPTSTELLQIGASMNNRVFLSIPNTFSQWLEFGPMGTVLGNAGNTGSFNVCADNFDGLSRLVRISAGGRVSTKKQANLCA